eukprot:850027-Pleurochrysis_carterae.AAC.3
MGCLKPESLQDAQRALPCQAANFPVAPMRVGCTVELCVECLTMRIEPSSRRNAHGVECDEQRHASIASMERPPVFIKCMYTSPVGEKAH